MKGKSDGELIGQCRPEVLINFGQNVLFGQKYVLISTELDIGSCVLAIENFVSNSNLWRLTRAIVITFARSDLSNFSDLRLFFSSIRKKNTASGFLL